MSSGVEADIALDAAVIASLGLVRVMGGTAGLAASGAGALAALAEGRAEAAAQRIEELRRVEEAVGEVLDRNARIAALAESARRHGVAIELPPPLDVTSASIGDMTAWAAKTDIDLVAAEGTVAASMASAMTGRIFDTATKSLRIASPSVDSGSGSEPRPAIEADLKRVLARLLPDAAEADRASVTQAAEVVMAAATPTEADGLLSEVRLRIQKANERTRERRNDRAAAARFILELADHPSNLTVIDALRAVTEGTRPFDDALRAEAARLLVEAQEGSEREYIAAALREAFGGLGYEIDEGFETLTARNGEAVITRGDWPQHEVKVRIDGGRQVRMALLRTEPAEGDEQRRLDVEREEQWCASFEVARERLATAGVKADVRWRIEPGQQRLPVTRQRRSTQLNRERRRERDR
ncbi:response regulator receiver protein [Actinoallomurus spadix]|uniref:Response regulator receiver protein n=1 Tax=Actinoallomurus spadix TaxID=79912 RepID=A0ABP3GZG1_9ACTN|nr:response regulator receiver protein [Actinoallomurus spadix]MCO5987011.1 response regulator receiver protein [Actinoallomurus spadix]